MPKRHSFLRHLSRRSGDADPGAPARAGDRRGARAHAAAGRSRRPDPVRRHPAQARVPQRSADQPHLESKLHSPDGKPGAMKGTPSMAATADPADVQNKQRCETRRSGSSMTRIFEGLTVLDCASFIAAPAAATILADFGAEVIKIEPPTGDPFRHLPRLPGNPKCEHNWAWMLESRNKQGLALDLSTADGQAVLYRMVPRADVFITNFPPAVRRRLGIAYRNLAPLNERLIYASFTGYG